MSRETQINNTFQIKEEFEQGNPKYFSPLPTKTQRCFSHGRSGKTKVYTEEQRMLFQMKLVGNEVEFEV